MGMTISQVAAQANVNAETVRYYERRKLLPVPERTTAGYRQYTTDTVVRIGFIKRAQELGFSLREIQELLSLRVRHGAACHDIEQKARTKIDLVERKIRQLEGIRRVLVELAEACRTRMPTAECPILEALQDASDEHGEASRAPSDRGQPVVGTR
jgi:MerR family copper efflux transcriptional regulator